MLKKSLFLLLSLTVSLANAQDMFQEYLYSADLVMKNRDRISLTDDQATKIKKIHSTNAADFSTLKWDLDAETEKLKKLLAQTKPDPSAVSKQMDLVLNLENQLKKKQLSTLVAIKNELTENQINDLSKTKVLGRVNSWEYAPNGTATTLSVPGTSYRIGKDPNAVIADSEKIAKVEPLNKSSVYIQTSPSSPDTTPLYYQKTKDGLKEFSSFENINPNDIESIEVLKGETATIKFGEKGKNGVIIITLKDKKEEVPTEF
jgi:Spy/CpxP family protein refolding chaperone